MHKVFCGRKLHETLGCNALRLLLPATRLRSRIAYHQDLVGEIHGYELALTDSDERRLALVALQVSVMDKLQALKQHWRTGSWADIATLLHLWA